MKIQEVPFEIQEATHQKLYCDGKLNCDGKLHAFNRAQRQAWLTRANGVPIFSVITKGRQRGWAGRHF
jgi:hypothetical protein